MDLNCASDLTPRLTHDLIYVDIYSKYSKTGKWTLIAGWYLVDFDCMFGIYIESLIPGWCLVYFDCRLVLS